MPNFSGVVLNQNQQPVDVPALVDAIVDDNPFFYYRTDETTGTAAADQMGNDSGTYAGGVTLGQTALYGAGKSILLNGSTGEITTATAVVPNSLTAVSVLVSFKTTTTSGGALLGLVDLQTGAGSQHDRMMWMDNTGKIKFGVWTGSATVVASTASYNDGNRHMAHGVLAANGNMFLYVDGVLVASNANTTPPAAYSPNTAWWRVGRTTSFSGWDAGVTSTFFAGTIDEIAAFHYALTSTQVGTHYAAATGPGTAGATSITADGLWRYQEFFLPSDYTRGSSSDELIIPALTGSQLFVGVTDSTLASMDWTLEYDLFGSGWQTLASGTATGAHATGDKVWLDLYFDSPVPITTDLVDQRFRLGFKPNAGISKEWITVPNPFATQFAKAYQADGSTVIQALGEDAAFCFRLLGRVADEGIDFLGNRYRSVVIEANGDDRTWLSKPNPSRFAVESLYYDVRPQTHDTYEPGWTYENYVTNPSLESGATTGYLVSGGAFMTNGASMSVVTSQFYFGTQSLQVITTATNQGVEYLVPSFTAKMGVKYTFSVYLRGNSGSEPLNIRIGDTGVSDNANLNVTLEPNGSAQPWKRYAIEWTPTADRTNVYFNVTSTAGGPVFYLDGAMIVQSDLASNPAYFDGNTSGSFWTGATNASTSRNGPAWVVLNNDPADNAVVIDSVLVDPTTPGVYFNVYYSSEGAPGTTADEWDDKLWTHVPRTFHALKRENHVLPEPIVAKYIKIEFSHLQARYYSPGDFARPIQYRKHPKWVLDYFLARTTAELAADRLFTGRVGVIYDAISLAYDYYLDDLAREPDQPVEIDQKYTSVQNFLSQRTDASDQIDSETLNKINLALAPYRNHPTSFAKSDYLLGQYAQASAGHQLGSYPTEVNPSTIDFPDVAELRNEAVVFESDFPVMFFYLTCRHKYREVVAEFSHDRAYFVGIKEIAFTRDRYTAATDSASYREPAGDLLNTERNDFTQIDGVMVIQ